MQMTGLGSVAFRVAAICLFSTMGVSTAQTLPPSPAPVLLEVLPTTITEAVGSFVSVTPLAAPQYLLHCKASRGLVKSAISAGDGDRVLKELASICSLISQAPNGIDYPVAELLNLTDNKVRIIGYGKTNQFEGNTVWTDNLPGWTSPASGSSGTYIEYVEKMHKMNIRYTLAGYVETAIDASQTELYVYVKPGDWFDTYERRGQACGLRGINILPSATTENITECAYLNTREKQHYEALCKGDVPCATTFDTCRKDPSIVTRKYVFWVRVGDELMRVVEMEPQQLNDSAWQNKWDSDSTHHGINPTWDESYTNGGTGLLAKVHQWDPSTYTSSFWSSNTPFLTHTLVGCTNPRTGFVNSDAWEKCLGLAAANQSSFALEMTGSLVIKDTAKRVKIRTKCGSSSCIVYVNGANVYGRTVTGQGWASTMIRLDAGVHSFRLEYFKRPEEPSPSLQWTLKNKVDANDDNFYHSEAFGPGARAFRHKLTVVRGIEGTVAVPHEVDEAVASPIYEGSKSNYCTTGHPEGHGSKLTYFTAKNAEAMDYWGTVSGQQMMGEAALHGMYFDASGFSLPSFNMGDARGRGSAPWNFETNAVMTNEENFQKYTFQYNMMQMKAYETAGVYPVMVANGNGPRYGDLEFDNFLRSGKTVKAGVFGHTESGFKQWNDSWEVLMKRTLYQFQNNLGMSMQCKADVDSVVGSKTEVTYNEAAKVVRVYEYCYAGYLMAKSKGNHTAQLEHDFTTFRGINTWYSQGINTPDAAFPVGLELPPMYTYPLGDPVEQISYAAWPETSYRVAAHTFARKFENGLVLINPYDPDGITPEDINAGPQNPGVVSEASTNHANDDTFELSHKMIDAATGEVVDRLTVRKGSARFLLHSPSWSGEVAGANQQHVPYHRAMGLDDYGQPFPMPSPKEGEDLMLAILEDGFDAGSGLRKAY
jgi:hypothetical protein